MGKKKDTTVILQELKKSVGENNKIMFKPYTKGFRSPVFVFDDFKYKCIGVSDKIVYGIRYYPGTKQKRPCNYPLSLLNYSTLNTLLKAFNKYKECCEENEKKAE